jgi:hypothetical protein
MTTDLEHFRKLAYRLLDAAAATPDPPHGSLVKGIVAETRQDLQAGYLGPRSERWVLTAANVVTRAGRERNPIQERSPELWQAIAALEAFYSARPSFFDLDATQDPSAETLAWHGRGWSLSVVTDPIVRSGRPPPLSGTFHNDVVFDLLGDPVWWIDTADRIVAATPDAPRIGLSGDLPVAAARVRRGLPALASVWSANDLRGLTGEHGLFALPATLDEDAVRAILPALAGGAVAKGPLVDRAGALCVGPPALRAALGIDTRAVLAAPALPFWLWLFEGGM